jgi:hypothetical protein
MGVGQGGGGSSIWVFVWGARGLGGGLTRCGGLRVISFPFPSLPCVSVWGTRFFARD